jgi:chromosome segregation ATPase
MDVSLGAVQAQLLSLQEAERAYWAEVEGGETKLLKNKAEVDQEQVKLSLLSAKVSKRNDELAAIKADVLALKNTALQADRVEKLQSTEMASEVAALTAQVTAAQNEVTELKMAINRRKLRLQQLQGV